VWWCDSGFWLIWDRDVLGSATKASEVRKTPKDPKYPSIPSFIPTKNKMSKPTSLHTQNFWNVDLCPQCAITPPREVVVWPLQSLALLGRDLARTGNKKLTTKSYTLSIDEDLASTIYLQTTQYNSKTWRENIENKRNLNSHKTSNKLVNLLQKWHNTFKKQNK